VLRLAAALFISAVVSAGDYRAGVARVRTTPQLPVWLVGFAARTEPARAVGSDLWAKALVLEDRSGGRVAIITADILGFTPRVTEAVTRELAQDGWRPDQLAFFASHTHSGPAVLDRMRLSVAEGPSFEREAEAFTARLRDALPKLVRDAWQGRVESSVTFGWSEARFAVNRRIEHLAGIRPGETFPAPVDHRVPVMRLARPDGSVLATVFGYACHNTVLTGDTNEVSGDFAGYAQSELETVEPGSTALFVTLTAGDQRASPRGSRAWAEAHGRSLATATRAARMNSVRGAIVTARSEVKLPFAAHTREFYAAEAGSRDLFAARRGRAMLAALDRREPLADASYPIQALRIGSVTLLALAGEVVVDYALKLRERFGDQVIPAAYANDLPGYIPSLRVQREGGYEAGDSLVYFLQPGWFTDEVETRVLQGVEQTLTKVGVRPQSGTR
jgi:hypothetical protein